MALQQEQEKTLPTIDTDFENNKTTERIQGRIRKIANQLSPTMTNKENMINQEKTTKGEQQKEGEKNTNTASTTNKSVFDRVEEAPADFILGLKTKYLEDINPQKVNLGIGAYRDEKGKPYKLKCVKLAEEKIIADDLPKEYLPQQGHEGFVTKCIDLLYGKNHPKKENVVGVQTLSGTGGLCVGLNLLHEILPRDTTYYMPNPTWGNHYQVLRRMGVTKTASYKYYDPKTIGLDYEGMIEDLKKMQNQSVVLLHLCAHNPTGVDPTIAQWKKIAEVVNEKGHIAFFDNAYQGFASGDLERDAYAIRLFTSNAYDMDVLCSQSFAKNLGLYGERIGCLSVLCKSSDVKARLKTRLKLIIRELYSSPPLHGARIVNEVLSSEKLTNLWKEEMVVMSSRIHKMRHHLRDELIRLGTKGNWDHITSQIGMFTFTGLSPDQVALIVKKFSIYMLSNGRISVAGLNESNVQYVAKAIDYVVRHAS